MPIVRSYYRRPAGMGGQPAGGARPEAHGLAVRLYRVVDGAAYGVRDRAGRAAQVTGLAFESLLPGGYGTATFEAAGGPGWGVQAGDLAAVWYGRRLAWMGYVEDIGRRLADQPVAYAVRCVGAWQICQQRQAQFTYPASPAEDTDEAVTAALSTYCPEISANATEITASGREMQGFDGTAYDAVATLIAAACAIGNTAGQPMLFALWGPPTDPDYRPFVGSQYAPQAWFWPRDLTDVDYVYYAARGPVTVTQTTRELANNVIAEYGGLYTAAAADADSAAAYRQRDAVVSAGDVDLTQAEAYRDEYLTRYAAPGAELASWQTPVGALRTVRGAVAPLPLVRAGETVQLGDGPLAGTVVLVQRTRWQAGVLTLEPEGLESVGRLLAG